MTKLDIYGGLLGAGKTTLIKAMLPCAYRGKKTAVIENEIGRVNLDAGEFSGITVRPLTAGCVCCTLKGDLVAAVRELVLTEAPEYIVMEASGAADLDAIRRICEEIDEVSLNRCIMVVNARKIRKLMTVVGEFYRIQLREASEIYLNFTENLPREELIAVKQLLRELNPDARVIDTPLAQLSANSIPEVSGPLDRERASVRPSLTVLDHGQSFKLLPNDRPARTCVWSSSKRGADPDSGSADHGKTLYTATLKVPAPLTEDQLDHFRQRLEQNGIWRAKGFVPMSDGTTKKIDYAFGDFFTSSDCPGAIPVPAEIVLIGENSQALSEKELAKYLFSHGDAMTE